MTRRPLPKIDPALDLSRHFLVPEQLPRSWDPCKLFPNPAPLEVEIGSGKGLFLSQAAAQWPDRNFLGIEIAAKYARYCAARLAKQNLDNAQVVHGDGLRVFAEFLPALSVAAVHVYFPDPWWKKRHKKRRVMKEQFLADIERVLVPNGALHFWTDVEEYFESTLELIRDSTQLIGPIKVPEKAPEHDLDFRTHFERRMRLHGEAVYRSEFRKSAD